MINSKELLERITEDNVIELMEQHGSPVYNRTTDAGSGQTCLWFQTICHGGDSHKLCYFTGTKTFYCYTSCGFMSFYDFIKKINDYEDDDFYSCLKFVADMVGVSLKQEDDNPFAGIVNEEQRDIINNFRRSFMSMELDIKDRGEDYASAEEMNDLKPLKIYDSKKYFRDYDFNTYYQGWIDEGISTESMKKFTLGWKWYGCYVILPHYDINGNLVGIRRRTFNEDEAACGGKYMPVTTYGDTLLHETGKNLYGIYENKKAIEQSREVIVVEGEKSVMKLDTYYNGDKPGVATCGFNISPAQIRLLKELGVSTVYVAFDKDFDLTAEAIKEYAKDERLKCNFNHYITKLISIGDRLTRANGIKNVKFILDRSDILGHKDSPVDKGKESFELLKAKSLDYRTEKYRLEKLLIK